MESHAPKNPMAIPKETAGARRTRRTTFRLPERTHRCIGILADFYGLTDKDFIDMAVSEANPNVWRVMHSPDAGKLFQVEAGAIESAGVRKTYVVTARVIASLEAGAKECGCSRDTYLQALVTIFRALVLNDAKERLGRWEEAKSRLVEGLEGDFTGLVVKAGELAADMDWPDGSQPGAVLARFQDCTIAAMDTNMGACRDIIQRLEKAPVATPAKSLHHPGTP